MIFFQDYLKKESSLDILAGLNLTSFFCSFEMLSF